MDGQKSWDVIAVVSFEIQFRRIRTESSISNEGGGVSFLVLHYLPKCPVRLPTEVPWETGKGEVNLTWGFSHSPRDQRLRQLSHAVMVGLEGPCPSRILILGLEKTKGFQDFGIKQTWLVLSAVTS